MEPATQDTKGRRRAWNRFLNILLTIAFLSGLAALGYSIAVPNTREFSEFYVLGLSGQADDYPRQLKVGEEGQVVVGIVNREQEVTAYRVEVNIEGEVVREIGPLELDDGERWQQVVGFKLDNPGNKQKVEFLFYKLGMEEPYHSIHLWIDAW